MAIIKYDSGRQITVPATETAAGPSGAEATHPVFAKNSGGIIKIIAGQFDFDSSYPTGGEDVSDIFNQFRTVGGIDFILGAAPVTVGTVIVNQFVVDYTGKKVLAFGEDNVTGVPAQLANLSNLSTVVGVRFMAWGL